MRPIRVSKLRVAKDSDWVSYSLSPVNDAYREAKKLAKEVWNGVTKQGKTYEFSTTDSSFDVNVLVGDVEGRVVWDEPSSEATVNSERNLLAQFAAYLEALNEGAEEVEARASRNVRVARINTLDEWMEVAAEALEDQDENTVEKLRRVSGDWMQTREEKAAQDRLLDAMEGSH